MFFTIFVKSYDQKIFPFMNFSRQQSASLKDWNDPTWKLTKIIAILIIGVFIDFNFKLKRLVELNGICFNTLHFRFLMGKMLFNWDLLNPTCLV